MAAAVKASELTVHDPIEIAFNLSGLPEKHAMSIVRDIIRMEWPEQRRSHQSVYSIRLVGNVAVEYTNDFSPVMYVGEGDAYRRLYSHTRWIVPLLQSVPQLGVRVMVVEVARRNKADLYRHIEADLLSWFFKLHHCLPWFNRQHETKHQGIYNYERGAKASLMRLITTRLTERFLWGIAPTPDNPHYKPYEKGWTTPRSS